MNKCLLSALFLLGASLLVRAQDPDIRLAFPTKDGFVAVGNGGENIVQIWSSKDGRTFHPVQQCKGWLHDAVVVGPRLVVATFSDGIYVIALDGSWKVEHTPVKDDYVAALASNGREPLVLTANKQQWRLSAEGKWTSQPFRFPYSHHATRLIFSQGVWVATGSDPNEDPDTGVGPTPIAWSADGQKWEPAKINKQNAGGIRGLAANDQGFLALTATGLGLVSADGKVWQPVELPPLSDEDDAFELFTAAGKFWLVAHGPLRLRSSVDGKTWTSSENLPMGMQLHFLVEKDGHAWIFGTDGDHFGVIARADQPHEPASPVPIAAAQMTRPVPNPPSELVSHPPRAENLPLAQARHPKSEVAIQPVLAGDNGFPGLADGAAWDGQHLLVATSGGIYRSKLDGGFECWIPKQPPGYSGIAHAGRHLWVWTGNPSKSTSDLHRLPPRDDGTLPLYYHDAVGRITGIAGEGDHLAFITEAGKWCHIYSSDDGGDRWRFAVTIGGLLPMEYGLIPLHIGPGLAYGKGRWVAVGRRADNTTVAAVSTDRKQWQLHPIGGPPGGMMRVVFAQGRFIASGHRDDKDREWTVATSPDGETWQTHVLPGEKPGLVTAIDDVVYAYNETGVFTTEDFETWRQVARHDRIKPITLLRNGDQFVLVGDAAGPHPRYQLLTAERMDPGKQRLISRQHLVVEALAEFDRAMHAAKAADPSGYSHLGAKLLKTLRAQASAHPSLPAFIDAMRDAIGHTVEVTSGFLGFYTLLMKVDDKDVQPLMDRLTPEQRESIREYAGEVVKAYAEAQATRRQVRDPALTTPIDKWPIEFNWSVPAPQSAELDMQRVYERIAAGDRGAVADLAIARTFAISVPGNGALARLWAETFNRLGGPPALLEGLRSGKFTPEDYGVLAQDGSAIMQFWEANRRSGNAPFEEIPDEDLALYEKSAAGGYRLAALRVERITEARAGKPASQAATAVEGLKAPAAPSPSAPISRVAELRRPATVAPPWEVPTNLVPAIKALASFERMFSNSSDFVDIGRSAGLLLRNLDARIDPQVHEAVTLAVAEYVIDNAGLSGFAAFHKMLPAPLADRAIKLLPTEKQQLWAAATTGGGPALGALRAWPPVLRTRAPQQGAGTMRLDQARARLLSGDAGGALDLGLEYRNGWGVSTDPDLFACLLAIASRLAPSLPSLRGDSDAQIDAFIAANSAQGRYLRARALMTANSLERPTGSARQLLVEAAERGHSLALSLLINHKTESN